VEAIMKKKSETLNQSGASAIEFALILPVLLLFLFGIIEFSVLFYNKAMITNASREGARAGIRYIWEGPDQGGHPSEATIIAAVNNYVDNGTLLISFGSAPANIGTAVDGENETSGDPLTVTVTYDYDFLILPEFADGVVDLTLTAETVMNLE
jgi:Flp pilus assembly protein TadG